MRRTLAPAPTPALDDGLFADSSSGSLHVQAHIVELVEKLSLVPLRQRLPGSTAAASMLASRSQVESAWQRSQVRCPATGYAAAHGGRSGARGPPSMTCLERIETATAIGLRHAQIERRSRLEKAYLQLSNLSAPSNLDDSR